MSETPRLSIGLPVYNGENYLASAVGSLQDQTFRDFELIICDNASTDRTAEICRVFSACDDRISYYRNDTNIGAAGNYNRCLELARGEYFKWAAHDDVCHPPFLEACISVLDQHPGVVLCHSRSEGIGAHGKVMGYYGEEIPFNEDQASARLWSAISRPHVCISVFGVMRRDILLRTIRHGDWVGADRNLLAELALHGKVELLPDFLFQRRQHAEASIHKFEDELERLAWFDPASAGKHSSPTWRRWREYFGAVSHAPLSFSQRLACYAMLLRWLGGRHHTGPRNSALLLKELSKRLSSARHWRP